MTRFFWSAGHIGWPLFGLIVFSVLCLLTVDVIWRALKVSFRKLLIGAIVVWVIGVAGLCAFGLL